MPYYLYQKSVATGVWECLERHHDFQAAIRARNSHNQGALAGRAEDALVTMVQGDTEGSARALLTIHIANAKQLSLRHPLNA